MMGPRVHGDVSADTRISVLFAETNEDIEHLLSSYLTEENDAIDVHFVPNASDGLRYLEDHRIDCIVSEFFTAGMDGLEFLKEVRSMHPDLPFILFTSRGSEEIASQAISAGVTDYVQKGGFGQYRLLANRIESAVENHRSQKQLEQLRRRYELVGKVATDAFYEEDLITNRVIRSQGYSRNLGYDPDEIPTAKQWWVERVHPDDRQRAMNVIDEAAAAGNDEYECTYRFRMGDGSYGYIQDSGTIIFDEQGPTRAIGVLTDITERKERELELECANKRLGLALEGAEIGVWEWDFETNDLRWDDQTRAIFQVSADSFAGTYQDFIRRVHPEDVDAVESAIDDAIDQNGMYRATFRILPEDEDLRWVEARGQVILDDEDQPRRLIGTIQASMEHRRQLVVEARDEVDDPFSPAV